MAIIIMSGQKLKTPKEVTVLLLGGLFFRTLGFAVNKTQKDIKTSWESKGTIHMPPPNTRISPQYGIL